MTIQNDLSLSIIEALGGDERSGKCLCPMHDEYTASLHVSASDDGKVLLHCFGCGGDVAGWAQSNGFKLSPDEPSAGDADKAKQRSQYLNEPPSYTTFRRAFSVMRSLTLFGDEERKELLEPMLEARGLDKAPHHAMLVLLPSLIGDRNKSDTDFLRRRAKRMAADDPGIVLPVVDREGHLRGAQVTWLNPDFNGKRKEEPQRQSYGWIKGNFVWLTKPDPRRPLVIAEGVETGMSVAHITGYPTIATLGTRNMEAVEPPATDEYIIAADADQSGGGLKSAQILAARIVKMGARVRIALPERPLDIKKRDWNDALNDGLRNGIDLKVLRQTIVQAKVFSVADATARRLTTRALDKFDYREIQWLWHPYIPRGMVTLMFGNGGVGKSSVLLDLAARITKGSSLPQFDGEPEEKAPEGSVLILSKEDDPNMIIRPRAEAAKASLNKLHMVGYETLTDPESFDPIERLDTTAGSLEQKIKELGNVKLIIVDPITDFVGQQDIYRDDTIRALLTPLARLAAQYQLAVVIVLHVNKNSDQSAHQRALGGVAFVNVPRSVVLIAEDPDDAERKFMVQVKRNLAPSNGLAAAFRMKTVRSYARVEWEPELVEKNAEQLLAPKKPSTASKQADAQEWLEDALADGPSKAIEIEARATAEGISKTTLKRAKKALGVISTKSVDGWLWSLSQGGQGGQRLH